MGGYTNRILIDHNFLTRTSYACVQHHSEGKPPRILAQCSPLFSRRLETQFLNSRLSLFLCHHICLFPTLHSGKTLSQASFGLYTVSDGDPADECPDAGWGMPGSSLGPLHPRKRQSVRIETSIFTRLMAEARRQASETLSKSALVLPTSAVVAGNASEIKRVRGHFDPIERWVTVKNVCAQYDVGTFRTHCSTNEET